VTFIVSVPIQTARRINRYWCAQRHACIDITVRRSLAATSPTPLFSGMSKHTAEGNRLCVCSLLRQVTSSVKVKIKANFSIEQTTKAAQRGSRGSVTGFLSEEVFHPSPSIDQLSIHIYSSITDNTWSQQLTAPLLSYLFIYLLIYLPNYLLIYLLTYLLTYLLIYLLTYLSTYLLTYLPTYLFVYLHTYLPTYLLNYLLTYLLTCVPTYVLT